MKCPKCLEEMWTDILLGDKSKKIDDVEIGICYGCASMYKIEGYVDPDESDPDELWLIMEEIFFYDIYAEDFDFNMPSAEDLIARLERAVKERKRKADLKARTSRKK